MPTRHGYILLVNSILDVAMSRADGAYDGRSNPLIDCTIRSVVAALERLSQPRMLDTMCECSVHKGVVTLCHEGVVYNPVSAVFECLIVYIQMRCCAKWQSHDIPIYVLSLN